MSEDRPNNLSDLLESAAGRARLKKSSQRDLSELASEEEESTKTTRTTIDVPGPAYQLLRRIAYEEERSQKEVWLDALELYAQERGY